MTLPLAIVRSRPRHVGTRIIDAVRRWWRLLARPRALRPRGTLPPLPDAAPLIVRGVYRGAVKVNLALPSPSDGTPESR